MSSENNQDRIDKYLLGRDSREEHQEFAEEITRNQELSNELAATETAMAAIELAEDQALKARLRQLEASLAGNQNETGPTASTTEGAKVVKMQPKRHNLRRYLAYAATLLLLLAVGWWALKPATMLAPGQLAMAEFEPYPNIAYSLDRSTTTDEDPEKAAYLAYENGDFIRAADRFAALQPSTPVTQFYAGQSLLAAEQFANAEAIFSKLSGTADFNLAQESTYFLALAQVGLGKADEARSLLTEIVTDDNHPMLTEAKRLLKKL